MDAVRPAWHQGVELRSPPVQGLRFRVQVLFKITRGLVMSMQFERSEQDFNKVI